MCKKRRGSHTISREDVKRKLVVMANVSECDLVSVVDEILTAIEENIARPAGYHIEYGGQYESAKSAGTRLVLPGALAIAGIFLILASAFGSLRDASVIMLNLPLALINGVAECGPSAAR